MLVLWKKSYDKPRQHIIKHGHHIINKGPHNQNCDFSSSHVWMWELDHKGWVLKNCAFGLWWWTRFVRVPWTARRSSQSILQEINFEYLLEGLMLKFQYSGHLMRRATHWQRPWCWEGLMVGDMGWQDGMVGWHHQLNGHESEQTPRDSEGQGSQAYYSPWGRKQSDVA